MSIAKVLIVLILIYVGYKVVTSLRRIKSRETGDDRGYAAPPKGEDLVQDPFCATYVPKSQSYVKEIDGREKYFCSRECCEKYLSERK
jgi:YHS domain-containing protein